MFLYILELKKHKFAPKGKNLLSVSDIVRAINTVQYSIWFFL